MLFFDKASSRGGIEAHGTFISKGKIPGLDGWPIKFYVGFYHIIEHDVLCEVEESKKMEKVLGAFNSTCLENIPKKDNPTSVDSYKPISKLIARKFKPILSKVISQEQFGFLEGRLIQ
jgi:hypothetical protein